MKLAAIAHHLKGEGREWGEGWCGVAWRGVCVREGKDVCVGRRRRRVWSKVGWVWWEGKKGVRIGMRRDSRVDYE